MSPALNTHAPAAFASVRTARTASITSGRSSSGNFIAPSSNETRSFGIARILVRRLASGRRSPLLRTHCPGSDRTSVLDQAAHRDRWDVAGRRKGPHQGEADVD